MSPYSLRYEWRNAINDDAAEQALQATTLEDAKVEAAILFATAAFRGAPPTGFCILEDETTEAYRYP